MTSSENSNLIENFERPQSLAKKRGYGVDRIEETEEKHFYNIYANTINSVTQRVGEVNGKNQYIRNQAQSKLS